jgi:hypothetical protein
VDMLLVLVSIAAIQCATAIWGLGHYWSNEDKMHNKDNRL